MCDLVHGSDSFLPLLSVAVGVVVAIPDFPYTTLTKKEVSGFPVWGLEGKVCDSVHPAEMMLGKACCFEGGKIVDRPMLVTAGDYVLIASGVADCVSDAACNAYKIVDTVELPNSPMYRTDIGCRLEKQLPLLQRHGYAECWEY
jgi:phosphoribosylamine--glycine ligase